MAAVVPGVVVFVSGIADGGFFPTAWGWLAIALFSFAGLALLLRERIALGWLGWGALLALAVFEAWTALSMVWSSSALASLREVERGLIYVAGLVAVLVALERRAVPVLLGGVLAGISAICVWSLGPRLFPSQPVMVDPFEGTLLFEPIGYANALGLLAALGVLLSLSLTASAQAPLVRVLSAVAPIVLLPVLYLSASRGAWFALAVGLAVSLALDPRRLRALGLVLVLAPGGALAVWLTARAHALRDPNARVADAVHAGHRLAVALVLLMLLAAGASFAIDGAEAVLRHRSAALRAGAALVVASFALLGAQLAREPGLGDRPAYWRVASAEYAAHPWLGSGAGTFEQYWQRDRPLPVGVRDAHNLYLETLAELGPLGLCFLLAALLVPISSALKARGQQLAPGATGAYTAFLVHASIDWDWEMPVVTLAALFCAVASVLAARPERTVAALSLRPRVFLLSGSLVLAALALAGLLHNSGHL